MVLRSRVKGSITEPLYSLVESLDRIFSKMRITNELISLTGWFLPLLFADPEDRFSRVKAQKML